MAKAKRTLAPDPLFDDPVPAPADVAPPDPEPATQNLGDPTQNLGDPLDEARAALAEAEAEKIEAARAWLAAEERAAEARRQLFALEAPAMPTDRPPTLQELRMRDKHVRRFAGEPARPLARPRARSPRPLLFTPRGGK